MIKTKVIINKNAAKIDSLLGKFHKLFFFLNIFLLLLSQISMHGSISYSAIYFTFSLYLPFQNISVSNLSLIALFVHWYKSAVDNTLLLNTFVSAVFSIEYLIESTLSSTKYRLEPDHNKKYTLRTLTHVEFFILFLDLVFFETRFLTVILLLLMLISKRKIILIIAIIDAIFMFCCINDVIVNNLCYVSENKIIGIITSSAYVLLTFLTVF